MNIKKTFRETTGKAGPIEHIVSMIKHKDRIIVATSASIYEVIDDCLIEIRFSEPLDNTDEH